MIEVDLVDQVSALEPQWDALAERLGAPPFLGPDWITAHWSAFGRGRLAIIAVRRDGHLGAVLPLAISRRAARSISNAQTPQSGLLAADLELAHHAIAAVHELGVSRLTLSYVDRGDPLLVAVRDGPRERRHRVIQRVQLRSPYIELQGTLAGYRSRLSTSFWSNVRRQDRRLAERGEVELDIRDGSTKLDQLLAQGWMLEASGWKGRLGTAVAAHPSTERFYADVAERAAARGRLRLCFLRVDDAPIAFLFGLEQGGVLYLLKGGFDPALSARSPGTLLQERVICYGYDAGLRRIELLGGDEPHKLRWTSTVHERISIQCFDRSPVRAAQWAAHAYGRPIGERLGLDRGAKLLRDRARTANQRVSAATRRHQLH